MNRNIRALLLAVLLPTALACGDSAVAPPQPAPAEPDAARAASWWPPQKNVWTPVGWKDHLFRFNVLYNGTLIAQPDPAGREATKKWAGQGCQLSPAPLAQSPLRDRDQRSPYQLSSLAGGGLGDQGWCDSITPVLWTEWPLPDGVVLREEVFAHVPGGREVESGVEPLYAWVRLSVRHVDAFKAPERTGFVLHLGGVHIRRSMEEQNNLLVFPEQAGYRAGLRLVKDAEGWKVLEPDGRVRLAGLPADSVAFSFEAARPGGAGYGQLAYDKGYFLKIDLPARAGACVDLLLPLLPEAGEGIGDELALGRDGAFAECESYWSRRPETAARVVTGEKTLDEALERSIQFAQVVAEKNPQNGEYSFLSGAWQYDRLWPTPTSMTGHMLLDNLGWFDVTARHLELFLKNQGTVVPPGAAYSLHPGYFSSPKSLTSIDWLSDHGAILYEVARHARLSGDRAFADHWLEAILKGCEWIRDARALSDPEGVAGVLPPAVATDRRVPTQSVWSVGWNYKGLTEAISLLRELDNPRAEEFAREAEEYRRVFVLALRESTARMPGWRDTDGALRPLVPLSLSAGGDITHAFYLDTGPLFLVWSGMLAAEDSLMRSSLDYFRHGPDTALFDPRGDCWQRPVLRHGISSCEPCYSWNLYHAWRLGDREHYLEGLYSVLTGALSRQTYISCETRHGIYGNVFASPLLADLVRLAAVDDALADKELHLLRLAPLAWIHSGAPAVFDSMPTVYGPLSLSFSLDESGRTLRVECRSRFRRPPARLVLHVPPLPGLTGVEVNGKAIPAAPGGSLDISAAAE